MRGGAENLIIKNNGNVTDENLKPLQALTINNISLFSLIKDLIKTQIQIITNNDKTKNCLYLNENLLLQFGTGYGTTTFSIPYEIVYTIQITPAFNWNGNDVPTAWIRWWNTNSFLVGHACGDSDGAHIEARQGYTCNYFWFAIGKPKRA